MTQSAPHAHRPLPSLPCRACEFSETLADHRSPHNDGVWLPSAQPGVDVRRLVENSQALTLAAGSLHAMPSLVH